MLILDFHRLEDITCQNPHDLSIVPSLAHRVGVMQAGRLVEQGSAEQILTRPQHPYTRALLDSVPRVDRA